MYEVLKMYIFIFKSYIFFDVLKISLFDLLAIMTIKI
jgi:hypothetical protein